MVSREPSKCRRYPQLKIAVPGSLTSAFLALRIFNPDFEYEVVPFDKIIDAVQMGRCDAGLLIHEGQLFYERRDLHKVLDLGEWWHERHGCRSMGGNVIERDLGPRLIKKSRICSVRVFVIRSTIVKMLCSTRCSLPATWTRAGGSLCCDVGERFDARLH